MLQQYCYHSDNDYEEDNHCRWVGEPYTPPRKRITNTDTLRLDEFAGWHYLIYDKYGHLATDSATHSTREDAMEALIEDMTPKAGYDDPAAPYTAVLFNVPSHITIKGTMFKMKFGSCVQVKP
jgi:hypothetical protein